MSDPEPGLSALILAAGRATRMRGEDKLLLDVAGQPCLRHLAGQALDTGLPVVVTLPLADTARHDALSGLPVRIVNVADPAKGMSVSLAAGIAALPALATGAVMMLGDMPEITSDDIVALARAFRTSGGDGVIRGANGGGRPGHPVILPARLFASLRTLSGDRGARDILREEDVTLVPLPGRHATLDLDTPEEWEAWREGSG